MNRKEERDHEKERQRSAYLHDPGRGVSAVPVGASETHAGPRNGSAAASRAQFRPCPVAGSDRGAEREHGRVGVRGVHPSIERPSSPPLQPHALHTGSSSIGLSSVRPRRPGWALTTAQFHSARDSEWPASLAARAGRGVLAVLCFPFPPGPLRLRWPRTVPGATASSKRGVVAGGCIGIGFEEALALERQWLVATGHAPTPLRHCPSPVRPTRHLAKAHSAPTHQPPCRKKSYSYRLIRANCHNAKSEWRIN